MSNRDLSTSRRQVFGDVKKGTTCRLCGRNVDDGRAKYCSEYCRRLCGAVMSLLNWSGVRRRIKDRDDHVCQSCGFDRKWISRGREHIRERINEQLPEMPEAPSILERGRGEVSDEEREAYREAFREWKEKQADLQEAYGDPRRVGGTTLEVDHITPISEGGHPFDPGNLQTLCEDCHQTKTAREAGERADRRTPSRPEIETTLEEFL